MANFVPFQGTGHVLGSPDGEIENTQACYSLAHSQTEVELPGGIRRPLHVQSRFRAAEAGFADQGPIDVAPPTPVSSSASSPFLQADFVAPHAKRYRLSRKSTRDQYFGGGFQVE